MTIEITGASVRRRSFLAAAGLALLLGVAPSGFAKAAPSGELVILQWHTGSDLDT